jgi:CMP-N,N'-diacetyllegionaminic acid synthase
MRVLGLITARGGSKGVPRKNIRLLGGKPLLQWTVESALAARSLSSVVLSTEDESIASLGCRFGAAVPFLRPAKLARDNTPTLPVIQHAIHALAALGEQFDAVCLLQPTNPFRLPADIDSCVDLLKTGNADAVISVRPLAADYNPHWVYFECEDGSLRLSTGENEPIPRRQLLPAAFHRDGSIYVTRTHVIIENNSLYGSRVLGYETKGAVWVNIDTLADWKRAEELLQELV